MKKFALVLLLIAAMASPAMAGQIQLGYASTPEGYFGMYKSTSGGEFTLNPLTGWLELTGYAPGVTRNIGKTGTFQSFCLEGSTDIDGYPTTYNADLNANAVAGGPGAPPAGDPVSVGTGWLYMQFATGIWPGTIGRDPPGSTRLLRSRRRSGGSRVKRVSSPRISSQLRSSTSSARRPERWQMVVGITACMPSTCGRLTGGLMPRTSWSSFPTAEQR